MLMGKQVLIIEDNEELQGILADFLEMKGADVDFSDNGELGLQLALEASFDVIILDVMLPKLDGMEVAKRLREQGCSTPILMLTALDGKQDLLDGFGHGVDDFVTKPFDFDELEVRLVALIKRHRKEVVETVFRFGQVSIDPTTREVFRERVPLALTPVTFQILLKLVKSAPDIVSRDELIFELWGDNPPDHDVLRSHIYNLRYQLDKPFERPLLITIPKLGFRLEK